MARTGPPGHNAGTGNSRLDENAACAELTEDLMRHGALGGQRNREHVLLGVLGALLDGDRHFLGLAHANADATVAIAHDDKSGQSETTTAFDDLGNAVNVDNALLKLGNGVFLLFTSHKLNPF